ncbi:claudin 15-like a [Triplophysa dalaica]|uniref:claudin 15-like a n=1 Tax=Triplophysa dalaica TaxID=1582913 RepID=UPI0024DFB898|nr:claudin 15-like a [Triplophysa dalaica]
MSTALEVTGFIMCVASWMVTGVSLANDYWKISSISGSVIISTRQYENLWHSCAEDSSGIAECRDFQSMLALPVHIQACRALMIIALILGLVSIIVSTMGMKCINIGSRSDQSKGKIALSGGVLFILAGLCSIVATSWYASRVIADFNDPFFGGIRFELGAGLYIAWAGVGLAILGGSFMCCAFKRISQPNPKGAYYPSNKSNKPKPVYSVAPESETARAYV